MQIYEEEELKFNEFYQPINTATAPISILGGSGLYTSSRSKTKNYLQLIIKDSKYIQI